MKPDTMLTPDGRYDRAAIMRDAHRQRRQMMGHEPLPRVLVDEGAGDAQAA